MIELLGRLMGELKEQATFNPFTGPEFQRVVQAMRDALPP